MRRTFALPAARPFTIAGTARVAATLPDDAVDRLFGISDVVARSDGRLPGDLASRASAAIDGDPATAWSPGLLDQAGHWIEVDAPDVGDLRRARPPGRRRRHALGAERRPHRGRRRLRPVRRSPADRGPAAPARGRHRAAVVRAAQRAHGPPHDRGRATGHDAGLLQRRAPRAPGRHRRARPPRRPLGLAGADDRPRPAVPRRPPHRRRAAAARAHHRRRPVGHRSGGPRRRGVRRVDRARPRPRRPRDPHGPRVGRPASTSTASSSTPNRRPRRRRRRCPPRRRASASSPSAAPASTSTSPRPERAGRRSGSSSARATASGGRRSSTARTSVRPCSSTATPTAGASIRPASRRPSASAGSRSSGSGSGSPSPASPSSSASPSSVSPSSVLRAPGALRAAPTRPRNGGRARAGGAGSSARAGAGRRARRVRLRRRAGGRRRRGGRDRSGALLIRPLRWVLCARRGRRPGGRRRLHGAPAAPLRVPAGLRLAGELPPRPPPRLARGGAPHGLRPEEELNLPGIATQP